MNSGEGDFEEEDFYSFFNISQDATTEDIVKAYRRLSLMYHPDRHQDPELKAQAERMFAKTRRAYNILSDPHKRAIYDTVGVRGLETQGWELVERRFSAEEIREEYERLRRQREAQTLREQANPSGGINVTVNATDLFKATSQEDIDTLGYDPKEFPYVEITGLSMQQSVEAPLTLNDRVVLGGNLQTTNGRGGGSLSLTWRRLISQLMWAEATTHVGDQVGASVKLVRTFSRHMFGSVELGCRLEDGEVQPGISLALTRQLDRRVTGAIVCKLGLQNSVTTSLVFDDGRKRHIVGAVVIGDRAAFVLLSYVHRFFKNESHVKGSVKVGTFGVITDCGYEGKISEYSRFGCSCRFMYPGSLTAKLRLTRASQNYQIDLLLCDSQDFLPTASFWGVVVPVLVAELVRIGLRPYLKRWFYSQEGEMEKKRKQEEALAEKRKEALATVELMRETALKIRDQEMRRNGLVIVEAWYGRVAVGGSGDCDSQGTYGKVIDVTTPLQTLVKDSKLLLYESGKAHLPGFFDPCPGEEKVLRVVYQFKGLEHTVIVRDDQPLFIPKQSHRVS